MPKQLDKNDLQAVRTWLAMHDKTSVADTGRTAAINRRLTASNVSATPPPLTPDLAKIDAKQSTLKALHNNVESNGSQRQLWKAAVAAALMLVVIGLVLLSLDRALFRPQQSLERTRPIAKQHPGDLNWPQDQDSIPTNSDSASIPSISTEPGRVGGTSWLSSKEPVPAKLSARKPPVVPKMRDIELDEPAQIALIRRGQDYLKMGNIAQARLAFQWATDAGNGTAALYLGDTYDPQRLAALGAVGIIGELGQSVHWYERADELGAPEAKSRLAAIAAQGGLR